MASHTEKNPRRRSMPALMGPRPPTGNPGSATALSVGVHAPNQQDQCSK